MQNDDEKKASSEEIAEALKKIKGTETPRVTVEQIPQPPKQSHDDLLQKSIAFARETTEVSKWTLSAHLDITQSAAKKLMAEMHAQGILAKTTGPWWKYRESGHGDEPNRKVDEPNSEPKRKRGRPKLIPALMPRAVEMARQHGNELSQAMLINELRTSASTARKIMRELENQGLVDRYDPETQTRGKSKRHSQGVRRKTSPDMNVKLAFIKKLRPMFKDTQGEVLDGIEKDIRLAQGVRLQVEKEKE